MCSKVHDLNCHNALPALFLLRTINQTIPRQHLTHSATFRSDALAKIKSGDTYQVKITPGCEQPGLVESNPASGRGVNWMSFEGPSNTNHYVILRNYLEPQCNYILGGVILISLATFPYWAGTAESKDITNRWRLHGVREAALVLPPHLESQARPAEICT